MANKNKVIHDNQTPKKYSKLKKIFGVVIDAALTGYIVALVGPELIAGAKPLFEDYKNNETITQDALFFDANMDIANIYADKTLFSTTYKRLPHNGDKPIFVFIDSSYTKDEVQLIENALDYYQELFTDINPNYKFEIVSKEKAFAEKMLGNTVITFEGGEIPEYASGVNKSRPVLVNPNFIRNNEIRIKSENLTPFEQYAIIIHELGHSFGLADSYHTEIKYHNSSFNQSETFLKLGMLYPNDVAILYAMYGENYRKDGLIVQEELEKSQGKFEEYKAKFYDKLSEVFQTTLNIQDKMQNLDTENFNFLNQSIYFYNQTTSRHEKYYYQIKLLDEINAEFVIKDATQNVLYTTTTKFESHNGMIYLPAVHLEKGPYPDKNATESAESYEMYAFYKTDKGIFMADMLNFAYAKIISPQVSNFYSGVEENILDTYDDVVNKEKITYDFIG